MFMPKSLIRWMVFFLIPNLVAGTSFASYIFSPEMTKTQGDNSAYASDFIREALENRQTVFTPALGAWAKIKTCQCLRTCFGIRQTNPRRQSLALQSPPSSDRYKLDLTEHGWLPIDPSRASTSPRPINIPTEGLLTSIVFRHPEQLELMTHVFGQWSDQGRSLAHVLIIGAGSYGKELWSILFRWAQWAEKRAGAKPGISLMVRAVEADLGVYQTLKRTWEGDSMIPFESRDTEWKMSQIDDLNLKLPNLRAHNNIQLKHERFQNLPDSEVTDVDMLVFNHVGIHNKDLLAFFRKLKRGSITLMDEAEDFWPLVNDWRREDPQLTTFKNEFDVYIRWEGQRNAVALVRKSASGTTPQTSSPERPSTLHSLRQEIALRAPKSNWLAGLATAGIFAIGWTDGLTWLLGTGYMDAASAPLPLVWAPLAGLVTIGLVGWRTNSQVIRWDLILTPTLGFVGGVLISSSLMINPIAGGVALAVAATALRSAWKVWTLKHPQSWRSVGWLDALLVGLAGAKFMDGYWSLATVYILFPITQALMRALGGIDALPITFNNSPDYFGKVADLFARLPFLRSGRIYAAFELANVPMGFHSMIPRAIFIHLALAAPFIAVTSAAIAALHRGLKLQRSWLIGLGGIQVITAIKILIDPSYRQTIQRVGGSFINAILRSSTFTDHPAIVGSVEITVLGLLLGWAISTAIHYLFKISGSRAHRHATPPQLLGEAS